MLQEMTVYLKNEVDQLLSEKDTEIAQLKQRIAELENGSPEPTTPDLPEVTYEVQGNDLLIKVTNGHARAWDIWSDRAKRTIPPVKADSYLYQNAATGEKFSVHWSDLPDGLSQGTFEYWTPDYTFSPGLDTEGNGPVVIIPDQPISGDTVTRDYERDDTYRRRPDGGLIENLGLKKGLSDNDLKSPKSKDISLVKFLFSLEDYKGTPKIPKGYFDMWTESMQRLAAAGLKAVITPAYIFHPRPDRSDEPGLQLELGHAQQIGEWLHSTRQYFLASQLGYAGAYGELVNWIAAGGFGGRTTLEDLLALIRTVLKAYPDDLHILIRSLRTVLKIPSNNFNAMLDRAMLESEAYTNTPYSKIGLHCDAMGRGRDESGLLWPYDNPGNIWDKQEAFIFEQTKRAPYGTEPNAEGKTWLQAPQMTPEGVIAYMKRRHTTYHNDFGNDFSAFSPWFQQTNPALYQEFKNNVGSRLWLNKVALTAGADKIQVDITWTNEGYSALHRQRPMYLLLNDFRIKLSDDIRMSVPLNGETKTMRFQVPKVASGTFKAKLWLPDVHQGFWDDKRFSYPLSNKNMAFDGANDLGISLVVS